MVIGSDGVLMEEGIAVPSGAAIEDPIQAAAVRAQGGDASAFAELVALTDLKILGLAWRLLGDRDLARDAAQEVYLRIHRSLGSFRPTERFRAWSQRITVNVCFDLMRKRGPFPVSVDECELAHPGEELAEEALLLEQRRALVQRALARLGPAERAAIVLRDLEGLSTEDAARALGVKPATLRGEVSTARAKLRALCAKAVRPSGGRP